MGRKDKSRSHSIVIASASIALTTTTDVDFGQNHLREAQREFTQRRKKKRRDIKRSIERKELLAKIL